MENIPVIYINKGKSASFYKGDPKHITNYSQSPLSYAKLFHQHGAKYLQIVDKDGGNAKKIREIIEKVPIKIQIAARLRSMELIEEMLNSGVDRVIVGVAGRGVLKEAITRFGPDRIFAGMKGKNETIVTGGEIGSEVHIADYAGELKELGVQNILYHDIWSEGTMIHPNFDAVEKLIYFTGLNVYSSGGVYDEKDLALLEKTGAKGVVIGKALYEKNFNLSSLWSN
jgi:phosphoribosylformimino-5-aminoimidazole carboxamide ribotide isomerase